MSRKSRRAMLTGLATAPLTALPALAAMPYPDAALLALAQDYFRADAAYRAASDADDRIRSKWESTKPPEPDALRRRGDFKHFRAFAANRESPVFYLHCEVDELRRFVPAKHCPAGIAALAEARAREIVAAYDCWRAEVAAHAEACGLAAAGRRCDEADDVRSAIGEAVKATRPTTLAGFITKASVGQVEEWPEFDAALREDLAAMAGSA